AIAGILPASVGSIVFDGTELRRSARERSRDQLREMQIVFQYADTALDPGVPRLSIHAVVKDQRYVEDVLNRFCRIECG
ncbi:hypothetical protein ACC699_40355, partial [Rhizobium ruizarguesonis]